MTGQPIRDWNDLISAINQLRLDWINNTPKEKDYKYTYDNYLYPLPPLLPAKIIDLPEGDDYQIIINNKSKNSIYFYQGTDGDERLNINNSAWEIQPRNGMIIETSGRTILWAISEKISDIIITIHSIKPNLNLTEMVIALNVDLKVGTGDLLGKDIPLSEFIRISSDWEDIIRDIIDSDQGITGHKLAYLRSFQPGATYEFNVNVAPEFTDFDSSQPDPINIHLVDSNQMQTALISAVAAMRGIGVIELDGVVKRMIGFAKSGGWVAKLPPTGGTFFITPGNSQSFLHFGAFTAGSSDACVITNFDKATNTITLGGY